ncbi:hypothetical protein U91I_01040 [alpha proteobacterium U9-1i]|nr:hypothetical protein U91I_01040 [alpha proteobacterium U9-1i]
MEQVCRATRMMFLGAERGDMHDQDVEVVASSEARPKRLAHLYEPAQAGPTARSDHKQQSDLFGKCVESGLQSGEILVEYRDIDLRSVIKRNLIDRLAARCESY